MVKATTKFVRKPVDTIKNHANNAVDCVKNPKKCAQDGANAIKDEAKGAVDCVKHPKKCANGVKDDVVDSANDIADLAEDAADFMLDCVKEPIKCAKKNPFWGLVPDCYKDLKSCFDITDQSKEFATYAIRIHKIASMAMWEVGETLLNIARESHKRRMGNCETQGPDTIIKQFPIPTGFTYKKTFPFIKTRMVDLKSCHRPDKWIKTTYNVFKECFLADLYKLGPKIIALWKDGELGDEATCSPNDNFAIVLKLQLMADTKYYFASAGGGIGLVFGCDNGEMKAEMVFDYEIGVKLKFDPKPLSVTLHQQVIYLKSWPSHKSTFMKDLGTIRVTVGIPTPSNVFMAIALKVACEQLLPRAVSEIMCGHAVPQTAVILFNPPKINLDPGDPLFEGYNMEGVSLGWAIELLELKNPTKLLSTTKGGDLAIVKSTPVEHKKSTFDLTSPSLGFHYGNTHVFGTLPPTSPCKGWPRYDDCTGDPCGVNSQSCLDGIDTFSCACSPGWSGDTCEIWVGWCTEMPCLNGGTCKDDLTRSSYVCECAGGFIGDNCGTNVNDCADHPCLNGASCVDGIETFSCECQTPFVGKFCQTDPTATTTTTTTTTTTSTSTTTTTTTNTPQIGVKQQFTTAADSATASGEENEDVNLDLKIKTSEEGKDGGIFKPGANWQTVIAIFAIVGFLYVTYGFALLIKYLLKKTKTKSKQVRTFKNFDSPIQNAKRRENSKKTAKDAVAVGFTLGKKDKNSDGDEKIVWQSKFENRKNDEERRSTLSAMGMAVLYNDTTLTNRQKKNKKQEEQEQEQVVVEVSGFE